MYITANGVFWEARRPPSAILATAFLKPMCPTGFSKNSKIRSCFDVLDFRIDGRGIRMALFSLCWIAILAVQAGAQTGLKSNVIAGGGGSGFGGNFNLDGTIGQAAAGVTSSGGTFSVKSGFRDTFQVLTPPPTLSGIAPSVAVPGTTLAVTLTGTNFIAGATQISTIPGITVSGASVTAPTSMVATFNIAGNAAIGARNVTVTTVGGTSGAATFNVVAPFADLTPTSSHSGVFGVGFNETYIVEVSNVGFVTSGSYTLTDTLPAGLTFVSGIGGGWSCSASGQVVTCINGSGINAGAKSPSLTITVAVSSPAAPAVSHGVSVQTAGDLVSSNNTASDQTTVAPLPLPAFTFNPAILVSAQQATMGLNLSSAFPHEVTGTVTLSVTPRGTLPVDPAVQFETGGRTVAFRIPANTFEAIFGSSPVPGPVGFQTGSIAGTLQFRGIVQAGSAQAEFLPGGAASQGFAVGVEPPKIVTFSTTTESLPPDSNGQPVNRINAVITLFSPLREVTEIKMTADTKPQVRFSCGALEGCKVGNPLIGAGLTNLFDDIDRIASRVGEKHLIIFDVKNLFDDFFASTSDGSAVLRLPLTVSGSLQGSIYIGLRNREGLTGVVKIDLP
jgi:uncharacterized repeat protein (TIGR01451 family)